MRNTYKLRAKPGRVGFIADAHGNPYGLQACLNMIAAIPCDEIFFLGDAVGYLPMANEVLHLLETRQVKCLMGNHEAMLLGQMECDEQRDKVYGLKRTLDKLEPRFVDWINQWPTEIELVLGSQTMLLVHGSPWDTLGGYVYPDSDLDQFMSLPHDAFLMAQTHRPFCHTLRGKTIVNVGSVGLPRDQGDMASFAVFDASSGEFSLTRVPFDITSTTAMARAQGHLPESVLSCLNRR